RALRTARGSLRLVRCGARAARALLPADARAAVWRPLGREQAAAERGAVAARRTAGAAARRADRSTRPGPASACLGDCRRAARGRRLRVLRDAEPRGARARRPRRGAARRARRRRDAGGGLPLNAVWLLLRKDLLVLRRSPVLLGALLAYPIVIALLVGLV